jgi:hypothetical protein
MLDPKNPLCALNGDGCTVLNILCLLLSINFSLLIAKLPINRKIVPLFFSEINLIKLSVKFDHNFACEFDLPSITVSAEFNKSIFSFLAVTKKLIFLDNHQLLLTD